MTTTQVRRDASYCETASGRHYSYGVVMGKSEYHVLHNGNVYQRIDNPFGRFGRESRRIEDTARNANRLAAIRNAIKAFEAA